VPNTPLVDRLDGLLFFPVTAFSASGGVDLDPFREHVRRGIEAGAAGVHFEDQLASEKKCGHLGGKVLVPTQAFIRTLNAARLAADVCGVPTILMARTDAHSATLITSDVDERDHPFVDRAARTPEGFYRLKQGSTHSVEHAIARGLSYAPYADLIWWETSEPDLGEAREFAQEMHRQHPGKLLAYNCSPSFNWRAKLDGKTIEGFQEAIAEMGYRFQFVTLAGFHSLNLSMFELAKGYAGRGMGAYSEMQEREFAAQAQGFTAVRHQREVGTGYFDAVAMALSGGKSSTTAMAGSTEAAQFEAGKRPLAVAAE